MLAFVMMSSAGAFPLLALVLLAANSIRLSTQSSAPQTDDFLGPVECLDRKFTRESCDLVFCPPWQHCIDGRCICKPAYRCPTEGATPVCGHGNKQLRSFCQAMALSCQTRRPLMSHFGDTCTADQDKFRGWVEGDAGVVRLSVPEVTGGGVEELLVCRELWDMAAANVACRQQGHPLGAASIGTVSYISLASYHGNQLPSKCVAVRCQGYENSLAECVIYDKTSIGNGDVATVTCEQPPAESCQFRCVNRKCVSLGQTCDGVDDCGDRSDEMCCKSCRNGSFRCSSGVCLHTEALHDGLVDCLDGADESTGHTKSPSPDLFNTEYISPRRETKVSREQMESQLSCGRPGLSRQSHDDDDDEQGPAGRGRFRRVAGPPTRPTQIQWQVAIEMNRRFHCGGVYIGGCWVLTAAHCTGPKPFLSTTGSVHGQNMQKPNVAAINVKFSLWRRGIPQASTDICPVEDVHIHHGYDPATRENDIALVQLAKLPFSEECLPSNSFITPVCLPWTPRLFHPNHTCTVSGWGGDGRLSQVLQWANVSLIEDCQRFYQDKLKAGMICAGMLGGGAGVSQGDDGGPLVCEDELGVSYLWGVVSWAPGRDQPASPGVYTQVAHYFEWIRRHTGWSAVTRFNA